ncbi:MAG: hypothetical protein GY764_00905 [Halieaceae bacterium]|nr:hypothetical protein [Halieaceae bacterium]
MPTLEINCQLFVAPLLWTGRRTSKRLSVSLDGLTKKRICFRDAKGEIREVNTIWQLAMKKALQIGIRKEKFTMHDRRARAPSDISPEGARDLLKHTTARTTAKPYRRLPAVLRGRKNL